MNTFEAGVGLAMRWVKISRKKREYELRAGETPLATLIWIKHSQAIGEWGDRRYHFHAQGWLHPHTDVSEEEVAPAADAQAQTIATYAQHASALTFADGHAVTWQRPSRHSKERAWTRSDSSELMRFTPIGADIAVSTQPGVATEGETQLLLLLGAFLFALAEETTEDAMTATTASMVAIMAST